MIKLCKWGLFLNSNGWHAIIWNSYTVMKKIYNTSKLFCLEMRLTSSSLAGYGKQEGLSLTVPAKEALKHWKKDNGASVQVFAQSSLDVKPIYAMVWLGELVGDVAFELVLFIAVCIVLRNGGWNVTAYSHLLGSCLLAVCSRDPVLLPPPFVTRVSICSSCSHSLYLVNVRGQPQPKQ